MTEQEPAKDQSLLHIKDEIATNWQQLPEEHQASMALVLMKNVLSGQWGGWLREAIVLLDHATSETDTGLSLSPLQIKVTLTHDDISQLPLTDAEKAQITEADIRRIERNVELNVYENIWDEIEAVTFAEIDAKEQGDQQD